MFATKTRRSLCIPVDILIDIDSKHVVLNQSNRLFGMPSSHQTNDLGLLGISPYLQMISQRTKNLRANMEKLGVDVDSIWDKSQIYCYKPLFIDDFPIKKPLQFGIFWRFSPPVHDPGNRASHEGLLDPGRLGGRRGDTSWRPTLRPGFLPMWRTWEIRWD